MMMNMTRGVLLSVIILITGCGSGGSSSSDGGGSARVFNGTENITISAPGVSIPTNIAINIQITGSQVTITDGDGFRFTGTLSGNNFTASGVVTLGDLGDGLVCQDLSLNYSGSVSGSNITGTISGSNNCTSPAGNITLTTRGSFNASSTSKQYIGKENGLKEIIRSAVN
jgi:hypothetical protein